MLIDQSKLLHRSKVEPKLGPAVGAREDEIAALEAHLGARFPLAYREYLLWIGNDKDGLLQGTDCFLDNVVSNEQYLNDLFEENGLSPLVYRPIVFYMHQGYIACWFRMGDYEEDPSVFSFSETEREARIRSLGTFTEWLHIELSALANCL